MTPQEMIQELWDREKIRELTYHYGLAVEAQDEEQMANLFTTDGAADFSSLGRGVIRGQQALKEFYRSTWQLRIKPFFTNHVIRVEGDRATGMCSLQNTGIRGNDSMIGAGRLHDEYQKVNGEWKFKSRRVEIFYLVPLSEGWAKGTQTKL
ncbi:MAG TPA: nuclear transport factor 2 family protein [Candidatus Binataceae bacterium]|nr:nuclear transport factor 2 family protein [Candidatus Binataceae bacterium]